MSDEIQRALEAAREAAAAAARRREIRDEHRDHDGKLSQEERRDRWRKGVARRRERRLECMEVVPVEPFQRHFRERQALDGLSFAQVARGMGWSRERRNARGELLTPLGDASRAQRVMGFRPYTRTGREATKRLAYATTIEYETAARLAEVMGMDYYEAGV